MFTKYLMFPSRLISWKKKKKKKKFVPVIYIPFVYIK